MKIYVVDAFTDVIFGGNPAGVVILPEGADFPDDETCIKTAAEMRYSETAFIKRLGEKEFNIRYFTPAKEVELCGHATIGSFAALRYGGYIGDGTYLNHTISGDIYVDVDGDWRNPSRSARSPMRKSLMNSTVSWDWTTPLRRLPALSSCPR